MPRLQQLHDISLILPILFSLYLCSDFLPGFALLSHGLRQIYLSTNEIKTYTEGHSSSIRGGQYCIKHMLEEKTLDRANTKASGEHSVEHSISYTCEI